MNCGEKLYEISGKVIAGDQFGRTIGFATANVDYKGDENIEFGVYAVEIEVLNKKFNGILNVGKRPTVTDSGKITYEVNIFNFDCDIYGEELICELLFFVRSEKKFESIDKLKAQIQQDIFEVKEKLGLD